MPETFNEWIAFTITALLITVGGWLVTHHTEEGTCKNIDGQRVCSLVWKGNK